MKKFEVQYKENGILHHGTFNLATFQVTLQEPDMDAPVEKGQVYTIDNLPYILGLCRDNRLRLFSLTSTADRTCCGNSKSANYHNRWEDKGVPEGATVKDLLDVIVLNAYFDGRVVSYRGVYQSGEPIEDYPVYWTVKGEAK